MAPATFYIVNGPRGEYYAVRNHQTGKVWTERTESAAKQQASDENLALVATETIDHRHLLDLMVAQGSPMRPTAGQPPPTKLHVESGLSRFLRRFRRDPRTNGTGRASR